MKILHRNKPWHTLDHIRKILINNKNYIKNYLSKYFKNDTLNNENLIQFLNDHSISFIKNKNSNYDDDIFINQYGNISSFPFIYFNSREKVASIKSGKYSLQNNLIIPKGNFIISPGTSIYLDNYSYFHIQICKVRNKPIILNHYQITTHLQYYMLKRNQILIM